MTDTIPVKSGVGVIVLKGRKVLVGERQGSHGEGVYAFPGGHIDPEDNSIWDCGEREVMEETGMLIKCFSPDHFRDELFITYDILGKKGERYVTPYLVAEYLHGGEQSQKDGREFVKPLEDKCKIWEWVTLDQLVNLIQTEEQRTWIPIQQVLFYLKQMWGE